MLTEKYWDGYIFTLCDELYKGSEIEKITMQYGNIKFDRILLCKDLRKLVKIEK